MTKSREEATGDHEQKNLSQGPKHRRPHLTSVIIPTLNASATLPEQLAALAKQTYEGNWEVAIADNGSTDNTREMALSWGDRLPDLRVLDASQRRGAGYARNIGAKHARGDLLAFCDADDVVETDWLAALVRAARSSDIVGGSVGTARSLPRLMSFLPHASTGCMAVWRDMFELLDGFDTQFIAGEDVEFSWRAQLSGYCIVFAPSARIWRRPRERLRDVAKQLFTYGTWAPLLYQEYREQGVPSRSPLQLLQRLGWLTMRLPYLILSPRRRRIWVRIAANTAGALVGSWKHRVLYFP